jgi:ATP-dependent Zn protease
MYKFKNAVFFCAFLVTLSAWGACDNEVLESLQVQETSMNFVTSPVEGERVVTIGKIKNGSAYDVTQFRLEIQYFDADKRLIDVNEDNVYTDIPKNDEIAFREFVRALKPQSAYASQQVRVTYAKTTCYPQEDEPHSHPQPEAQNSKWLDWFINWFPLLLLLVLYVFFIRRCAGKNNPALRSIERQVDLTAEQNKILERIANAQEEKNNILAKKDEQTHD